MKNIYLLCFDMRNMSFDYEHLFRELRDLDGVQAQPTIWLVQSVSSVSDLSEHFLRLMSDMDGLLIIEIAEGVVWAATRLNEQAGEWLKRHRP